MRLSGAAQAVFLDFENLPNHNWLTLGGWFPGRRLWSAASMTRRPTGIKATVEIHVYGQDLRGLDRVRYNLETGRITGFVTGKYDNC